MLLPSGLLRLLHAALGGAQAGQMRVIEGEGVVALQSRYTGEVVWTDLMRVSLPFGRAAKLVVKLINN